MIRGGNVICGTSTTGTGTLTLAATPTALGGTDFYAFLTGINFVSGNAVILPYDLIEYTDNTFATPKRREKGWGTCTLGGSITATTFSRDNVVETELSGGAFAQGAPSAITIGTAANTLLFIGIGAADVPAFQPYFETSLGDALGVIPFLSSGAATGAISISGVTDYFWPFQSNRPILAKRLSLRVSSATTGTTNAYASLYLPNGSGRPGKLLCDFGALGTVGSALNAVGNITSAALANGVFMPPGGEYVLRVMLSFGGTNPNLVSAGNGNTPCPGMVGTLSMVPMQAARSTGASSTAPDPANMTGYAQAVQNIPIFTLAPS